MSSSPDAIVIGAGPNGLVAANLLANAGWSVLVLEAQPEVGGAVRSDRELDPAFVHDTFSAFYPLGAASPVIRGLGLEDHGLRWRRAPAVLGNPLPDGSWAMLYDDVDDTCAGAGAPRPRRRRAVAASVRRLAAHRAEPRRRADESRSHRCVAELRILARLPKVGGLSYLRMLLEPAALDSPRAGSRARPGRCCSRAARATATSRSTPRARD